ncbi:MAG TPA: patatin-like phospholipase family protein [Bryobacteraceae bacterium]|nr:patatin-like phospholipase family protein [Bryobacteraceae bacterium]
MGYRILSLDGFGVWALIEVKALIALYGKGTSGHDVLKKFDLVAGNSGGSIVLGSLVENLTLGKILGYFEDEEIRRSIFSLGSLADVFLHDVAENLACLVPEDSDLNLKGIVPKYSAKNKLPALRSILPSTGDVPLSKVTAGIPRHGAENVHLLITAFDYDLNRAVFFRSSKIKRPHWGEGQATDVTLAEAIHASSNAPVSYFDMPAQFAKRPDRYWDGAIAGCNNPVLAAVAEAVGKNQNPTNLAVLSIGTAIVERRRPKPGQPPLPYEQAILKPGIVPDLRKLATAIIEDPPDISTFLAHIMTGSGKGVNRPADSRVVRMNPLIGPVYKGGTWSLPGSMTPDQFNFIKDLDLDAVLESQVHAIARYADLWLKDEAPNQPIRTNGKTFRPELGQGRFSKARAAWKAISQNRSRRLTPIGASAR